MSGLYIEDSLGVNFGAFGGVFITAALALFAYYGIEQVEVLA